MLAGLITPSGGSARIAGYILGAETRSIRQKVGILTETPGLYERLSALDNLVFFGQLAGLSRRAAAISAEQYLRALDLWPRRAERVGGFSKGMRQKLAIVRALLHDPTVIFLDEPTAGLDPASARFVLDFIKHLRSEGRTIFLTTHNLAEADELADLVGVFKTRMLRLDTPTVLRHSLFGRGSEVRLAGPAIMWEGAVRTLPFVRDVLADGEILRVTLDDPENDNPILVRVLVTAGAQVRAVAPISHSLENVYLELLGSRVLAAEERV
jgi:ABC-2 type transport system ATP-binding protein